MATASVHIPDPGKSLRDITHGVEGGLHDVKHATAPANQELDTLRGSGCDREPGDIRGPAGCAGGRQPLRAPVWRQARRSNGPVATGPQGGDYQGTRGQETGS